MDFFGLSQVGVHKKQSGGHCKKNSAKVSLVGALNPSKTIETMNNSFQLPQVYKVSWKSSHQTRMQRNTF
jgi:hypothetical protein